MAVNIPGLIAVIVFYIIIFLVGVLAAKIQSKRNRQQNVRGDEEVMLAGRNLGWFVGCFTMTGKGRILASNYTVWVLRT